MNQTFRKNERIVSKKLIDELFTMSGNHTLVAFPIRVVYKLTVPLQSSNVKLQTSALNTQILISVPKKRFKHAVDRNRVKRQVREAFRKNKRLLDGVVPAGEQLLIAFIWIAPQHQPSTVVEARVVNLLKKIAADCNSQPAVAPQPADAASQPADVASPKIEQ